MHNRCEPKSRLRSSLLHRFSRRSQFWPQSTPRCIHNCARPPKSFEKCAVYRQWADPAELDCALVRLGILMPRLVLAHTNRLVWSMFSSKKAAPSRRIPCRIPLWIWGNSLKWICGYYAGESAGVTQGNLRVLWDKSAVDKRGICSSLWYWNAKVHPA